MASNRKVKIGKALSVFLKLGINKYLKRIVRKPETNFLTQNQTSVKVYTTKASSKEEQV